MTRRSVADTSWHDINEGQARFEPPRERMLDGVWRSSSHNVRLVKSFNLEREIFDSSRGWKLPAGPVLV